MAAGLGTPDALVQSTHALTHDRLFDRSLGAAHAETASSRSEKLANVRFSNLR